MTSQDNIIKDLIAGPFLFIVNPNSGTGNVQLFQSYIDGLNHERSFDVVVSDNREHSIQLAREAASKGYGGVVAVGGDGSVHEIGVQLIDSSVPLGIIPTGSGNGISRHLGISNNVETAVLQVLEGKQHAMDTFTVNGVPGIGFCGCGIDAYVAQCFAETNERGFSNYVKLTIDAFGQYQPGHYTLNLENDQTLIHQAYTVVLANITQFGNNAFINPDGIDDDGKLDLIVIKDFPAPALMPLASRLFLKNISKSKWVHTDRVQRLELITSQPIPYHIDGEPMTASTQLEFEIKPQSLNVIVPQHHV